MANMIPTEPREYDYRSGEKEMFDILNQLPEDYTVIHSTKLFYYDEIKKTILYERKNIYLEHEREIDFIIFHPPKGILCLEAKNFTPIYENGVWKTPSKEKMKHDGPYRQAESVKNVLIKVLNEYCPDINCLVTWGVWFFNMPQRVFEDSNWPPTDAPKERTMTKEARYNIQKNIDSLFDIKIDNFNKPYPLSAKQAILITDFLIPRFEYVPTPSELVEYNENTLNKLLEEQKKILYYLEDQKTAVIHGIGGTGKTMIAVARAKELAIEGNKILFLCFNTALADYLNLNFANDLISYKTIDSFVLEETGSTKDDPKRYEKAAEKFTHKTNKDVFYEKYQHIVVDEGQDFSDTITYNGSEEIGSCYVIEALANIVLEREGSFFFFYDKHQLIFSKDLSSFINQADCKLSLYINCRNTTWISQTTKAILNISLNSDLSIDNNLKNKISQLSKKSELIKYKTREDAPKGERTKVYFANGTEENKNTLDEILDKYIKHLELTPSEINNNKCESLKKIVILTGLTDANTFLNPYIKKVKGKDKWYYPYKNKYNIEFSTCRKFKGLEANVIILIDIDERFFNTPTSNYYIGEPNNLVFYVGASRAKHYLDIIMNMNDAKCKYIADKLPQNQITKPQKKIKEYLCAK